MENDSKMFSEIGASGKNSRKPKEEYSRVILGINRKGSLKKLNLNDIIPRDILIKSRKDGSNKIQEYIAKHLSIKAGGNQLAEDNLLTGFQKLETKVDVTVTVYDHLVRRGRTDDEKDQGTFVKSGSNGLLERGFYFTNDDDVY